MAWTCSIYLVRFITSNLELFIYPAFNFISIPLKLLQLARLLKFCPTSLGQLLYVLTSFQNSVSFLAYLIWGIMITINKAVCILINALKEKQDKMNTLERLLSQSARLANLNYSNVFHYWQCNYISIFGICNSKKKVYLTYYIVKYRKKRILIYSKYYMPLAATE